MSSEISSVIGKRKGCVGSLGLVNYWQFCCSGLVIKSLGENYLFCISEINLQLFNLNLYYLFTHLPFIIFNYFFLKRFSLCQFSLVFLKTSQYFIYPRIKIIFYLFCPLKLKWLLPPLIALVLLSVNCQRIKKLLICKDLLQITSHDAALLVFESSGKITHVLVSYC